MEFFDTHAHYTDEKFDEDRYDLIKNIYEEGITKILCAGYNIDSSNKSTQLSKRYDFVYTAIRDTSK